MNPISELMLINDVASNYEVFAKTMEEMGLAR